MSLEEQIERLAQLVQYLAAVSARAGGGDTVGQRHTVASNTRVREQVVALDAPVRQIVGSDYDRILLRMSWHGGGFNTVNVSTKSQLNATEGQPIQTDVPAEWYFGKSAGECCQTWYGYSTGGVINLWVQEVAIIQG